MDHFGDYSKSPPLSDLSPQSAALDDGDDESSKFKISIELLASQYLPTILSNANRPLALRHIAQRLIEIYPLFGKIDPQAQRRHLTKALKSSPGVFEKKGWGLWQLTAASPNTFFFSPALESKSNGNGQLDDDLDEVMSYLDIDGDDREASFGDEDDVLGEDGADLDVSTDEEDWKQLGIEELQSRSFQSKGRSVGRFGSFSSPGGFFYHHPSSATQVPNSFSNHAGPLAFGKTPIQREENRFGHTPESDIAEILVSLGNSLGKSA